MATAARTMWSLATVKAYLGTVPTAHDAILEKIADGASALIEALTGYTLVTRTLTEIRDGDGGTELYLRQTPVVTLAGITVLRTPTDLAAETVSATNYRVNKDTGRVAMHGDRFTRGVANVTLSYDAGYGAQDSGALPREFYEGGLDLVKVIVDERLSGATGASQISVGPSTFIVKPDWPKHVKAMLNRRRAEV